MPLSGRLQSMWSFVQWTNTKFGKLCRLHQGSGQLAHTDRKRADTVGGVALPNRTRKYKARLVAQGYTQVPGVDFNLTYAPVCKYATVRAVIASVANDGLCIKQLDVKTAFLNSPMDEVVYMKQPFGFNLCRSF